MRAQMIVACVLLLPCAALAQSPSNDNNVWWDGLAHVPPQGAVVTNIYRPDGDPATAADEVTLRARTYRWDVTGVKVMVFADAPGAEASLLSWTTTIDAAASDCVAGVAFGCVLWEFVLPGSAEARRYCFEVSDGSDVDYLRALPTAPFYQVSDGAPTALDCWLIPAPGGATDAGASDLAVADARPRDTGVDAGAQPDAWVAPDSGPALDTGATVDASSHDAEVDTGAQLDAWVAPDASPASDAAAGRDTSPGADASSGPDNGAALDSGASPDAGGGRDVAPGADAARDDAGEADTDEVCTPGCEDETHRRACSASSAFFVIACSAGTTCVDGVCAYPEDTVGPAEDEGCECSGAGVTPSWVLWLVLAAGLRARSR